MLKEVFLSHLCTALESGTVLYKDYTNFLLYSKFLGPPEPQHLAIVVLLELIVQIEDSLMC